MLMIPLQTLKFKHYKVSVHRFPFVHWVRIAITENSRIYIVIKNGVEAKNFQIKERIVSHVKYIFTIVWTLNIEHWNGCVERAKALHSITMTMTKDGESKHSEYSYSTFNTQFKSSFNLTKFHFIFVLL